MNLSLNFVQSVIPHFGRLAEQPIVSSAGQIVGWHSTVLSRDSVILAGGTHSLHEVARRIALAEALERSAFHKLHDRNDSRFRTDDFPSTSGFAAGFEESSTRFRAIAEAIERWAWSKWIDDHFSMGEVGFSFNQLSPLATHLLSAVFSEVLAFKTTIQVESFFSEVATLQFCVVLGLTEQGVFPGSRVTGLSDDPWTHAAIEAWRHHSIAHQNAKNQLQGIITDRVLYFSTRKSEALDQIRSAKNFGKWPSPQKLMLEDFTEWQSNGVFITRAICNDYLSWDQGRVNRFVY